MEKLRKIIVVGICSMVILTGCGNSMFTKETASSELALEEKEVYEAKKEMKEIQQTTVKEEPDLQMTEEIQDPEVVQLSDQEHREINIFFSNFSEAYLTDYDINNKDLEALINFAYIHHTINNHQLIGIEDDEMFIEKSYIDKTINQFFGVEISHQSVGEFQYRDGKYYTPAGDGENYNKFSQVDILQDNKDGTYLAEISIYSTEDINQTCYEPEKNWENTYLYEYLGGAKATIKSATMDGKETYQLLKYEEIKEHKKQEEVATKEIYSLNEVCVIAKKEMQLLDAHRFEDEDDAIINGEVAYFIEIEFMAGDMPRLDQIYIGSETLNVYNDDESFRMPLR